MIFDTWNRSKDFSLSRTRAKTKVFTTNYLRLCVMLLVSLWTGSGQLALLYAQNDPTCGQLVQPVAGPAAAPVVTANANPVSVEDKLYFVAGSRQQPAQKYLWRTDGTPSGTYTITASVANFTPNYLLTGLNGNLLLRAATPATGAELWRSTGDRTGAQLLKEVKPGPTGATYTGWFVFAGRFYFALDDEAKAAWWSTDGTTDGTVLLTTHYRGPTPVNAQVLAQDATTVYLTAHLSDKAIELWRFDQRGFQRLKTFTAEPTLAGAVVIGQGVVQNGKLYFFAGGSGGAGGLWRSDGTSGGTTLLLAKPLVAAATPTPDNALYPYTLVAIGRNTLYFFEDDPPLLRLWRLESDRDRFTLVKTLRVQRDDGLYTAIRYDMALAYNNKLYFSLTWHDARNNLQQTELWQSDGADTGTVRLTTLPFAARLALVGEQGLLILGPASLLALPWGQAYPSIVCTLNSSLPLNPTLFTHQGQLYLTGRNAGTETANLWHLDPATLQTTTIFLPVVTK
jgi:ELWxxDGT repeat protein